MVRDMIIHYFYLLGLNPNDHAKDYEDRGLDDLPFIPPPPHFVVADWATPYQPGEDDSEERSSHFTTEPSIGRSSDIRSEAHLII